VATDMILTVSATAYRRVLHGDFRVLSFDYDAVIDRFDTNKTDDLV
jgi:hypothetical protein